MTGGRMDGCLRFAAALAEPAERPQNRVKVPMFASSGLAIVPGTPKTADLNSLTKQLSAAGITLGLLPGEDTASGTDSAALIIGLSRDVPGGLMRRVQSFGAQRRVRRAQVIELEEVGFRVR